MVHSNESVRRKVGHVEMEQVLGIFCIFRIFYEASLPGLFTIFKVFDLWNFEEFPNEIIYQDTNIIFEKHLRAILFAQKYLKI